MKLIFNPFTGRLIPKKEIETKVGGTTTITETITIGGGEDTNVHTIWLEKDGPSSYTTGGFSIDLSSTFTSIGSADVKVIKGTRGNVPFGRFEYAISGAILTIKIMKERFDRITGVGNVQNQPAGVTVQATSGQTSSSEAAHTHDATHDHPAAVSAAMVAAGVGVDSDALAPAIDQHTHIGIDLPSFALTTGAGSSHNHTDNTIYDHDHAETQTPTNYASVELANATNLSATLFSLRVTGQRA